MYMYTWLIVCITSILGSQSSLFQGIQLHQGTVAMELGSGAAWHTIPGHASGSQRLRCRVVHGIPGVYLLKSIEFVRIPSCRVFLKHRRWLNNTLIHRYGRSSQREPIMGNSQGIEAKELFSHFSARTGCPVRKAKGRSGAERFADLKLAQ